MKKIRIGTRKSRLACIQAQMLADYIEKYCEGYEAELVTVMTTGCIAVGHAACRFCRTCGVARRVESDDNAAVACAVVALAEPARDIGDDSLCAAFVHDAQRHCGSRYEA